MLYEYGEGEGVLPVNNNRSRCGGGTYTEKKAYNPTPSQPQSTRAWRESLQT